MAVGETARLIASLELKDLFTKQIGNAEKSLGKFDTRLDQTQGRAYRAGQQIGIGIKRSVALAAGGVAFLTANLALGIESLEKVEKVTTQTNAVLKSTHDVSKQTAQGIRDMANQFESLNATMDDTTIQSGANVLLTFTNIREKAFKPALQAALDLSTAMGQDLQSSVVQIGKALNDPIKGLTSLTRVGVTFNEGQKKQIKDLVKQGDLYGAQKVILAELNREFAGSFLGQGNTTAGKVAKFKDAVDDLQRVFATAMLPVISRLTDIGTKFLADPAIIRRVNDLGNAIAGLFSEENLKSGASFLTTAFQTFEAAAPVLTEAAKATLGFVQAGVAVFNTLPDPIKALAVGTFALNKLTGGLVTNIGGALFDLIRKSRGATPLNPVFVSDVSGGLGGAGTAAAAASGLPIVAVGAAFLAIVGAPFYTQWLADHGFGTSPGRNNQGATNAPGGGLPPGVHTGSRTPNLPGFGQFEPGTGLAPGRNAILDKGDREAFKQATLGIGKAADDMVTLAGLQKGITAEFRGALATLEHSRDPKAISSAIKSLETVMVANGHGSVQQTNETIHALETELQRTRDPKLEAVIKATIHDLKEKVPGREYAQKQIEKANKIIGSTRSVEDKIRGLQAIERDLKDHKLPGQTRTLQEKIDALKTSQARAQSATTQAVKDKDLSVTIHSTTPPVYLNGIRVSEALVRATQAYREH